MHRFRARLYKVGVVRCIDVPSRLSSRLGPGAAPPVRGTIEAVPFRSTLLARRDGAYRLCVHSRIWRPRGLDAGDDVHVEITRDDEPREAPVLPGDFVDALQERPLVRRYIDNAAPSLRREIALWLAAAKRPETRERRIAVALDRLEERAGKPKPRPVKPARASGSPPRSARPTPRRARRTAKAR
ncbi:MAG TPA: YdeI/OmpD-associated family protein [Rhodanobacteraceae bacterium]|nr:YdeI/OmpD-associated family protein [Rhodanobacteraceae bacterium]